MKKPQSILMFLALLAPISLFSQTVIKGRVSDAQTGEPLAGANVQIVSSDKGVATDAQGLFTLNLTDPKAVIRVTYLGYLTEIQSITRKSSDHRIDIALTPTTINTDAVVVTATRNMKRVNEIPGRTEWLSAKQMDAIPAVQADDYLRVVPGIQVSREHGILDHSTTVSMRGLGGDQQGRYLVLLDGVPMNKADGGSVNWNSINSEEIGQIEIAKGPISSLYGGNAMGGVINYIRKNPVTPLEGSAQIDYGSMNTQRGRFCIGGNPKILNKGLYWGIQGFGAKSDGFIQTPEEEIDSTIVASYMKEYGGSARVGYKINDHHQIEVSTGYWWDRRGTGTKIFAETGTYYAHGTLDNSIKYSGNAGKANWSVVANSKREDYSRLNESIKASGDSYTYTSYSVTSQRNDDGLLLHSDLHLGRNLISVGGEYKQGSVFGQDIYTTSTDTVTNQGKIRNFAAYVQDQFTLINEHLFLIGGLRLDHSTFYDGAFFVASPTSATKILNELQDLELDQSQWSHLSPKMALKYTTGSGLAAYLSYGNGFRPSILDDMCRSGFVRGGFKRANPFLGPEKINNFEAGADLLLWKKFKLSASGYYSAGKDFIYMISTGDSIKQGSKMKPVLEANNISGVRIMGLESSLNYDFGKGISGYLQYVYTNSTITDYEPEVGMADLQGKTLIYVPKHSASAGVTWRNRWVNVNVQGSWLSEQWMDDVNSVSIPAYFKLDARIWTDISNFRIFVNGQNLTNVVYLEGHGTLSLGRFINGGVAYRF